MIGASLGCEKLVYYYIQSFPKQVKKMILICPQDMPMQIDDYMLHEAIIKHQCNKGMEKLSNLFLNFSLITANTLLQIKHQKAMHNFPYLSNNPNFDNLEKIKIPVHIIIGTMDQGLARGNLNPNEYMNMLIKHLVQGSYTLIEGAKHNFKGYEQVLCEKVISFLKI